MAPDEPSEWDPRSPRLWLLFGGLVGASMEGGGVIDGSGSKWWAKSCKINKSNVVYTCLDPGRLVISCLSQSLIN